MTDQRPAPLRDMSVHQVPLGDLVLFPGNARRGDIDKIARSLAANGQYRPIIVRRETGEILGGNHTFQAARQLGWETVLVTYLDGLSDAAARKIVLVDNKTNDAAGYDEHALAELLASLEGDYEGSGFDDGSEIAELLATLEGAPAAQTDVDDIPELPSYDPITSRGQVWELGPHRLVVGDSTDAGAIAAACGGRKADMLLTDPPYNVAYQGGTKDSLTIANDSMGDEAFREFLTSAMTAAAENTVAGGAAYIFYASSETPNFRAAMVAGGWLYKQDLVWIKDRFVLSRQDYHWQHEPVLYGWKPGAAHRWFGGFTPSTVADDQVTDPRKMTKAQLLEIVEQVYAATTATREPRPARNEDHPTSKPVDLLVRYIENSSRIGDLVLDPFGGSGSTLIAAHTSKRKAATVELDPRYADVIARRWQAHTGVLPIDEQGHAVDFLAHHRLWREQAEETG
jgi:site-specific DNA-methyltransferase (adenine-specific)